MKTFVLHPNRYHLNSAEQLSKCSSFIENCIVSCGLPLSIVDNEQFKKFVHDLDAKFVLPSGDSINSKHLPCLLIQMEEKVKKTVEGAASLSLTVDIWTDRRNHAFLAVTGHTFVKLSPKTFLLAFECFKRTHTGTRIAEEMEKIIVKFNLKGKVSFVVSDNASNMKKAFQVLEECLRESQGEGEMDDDTLWEDLEEDAHAEVSSVFENNTIKRLPCFAHTLQLAIKDGLSTVVTSPVLSKCKALANLVHHSALFKGAFEEKFGENRSIPAVNATRWNSLFFQLKAVSGLDMQKLAALLKDTEHHHIVMSAREVIMLNELVGILEPFAEATDNAQGDSVLASISCVVPTIVGLFKFLNEALQTCQHHLNLLRQLKSSLEKRFRALLITIGILPDVDGFDRSSYDTFGGLLYPISSVLDPSYGLVWLDEDHPGDEALKAGLRTTMTG